MLRASLCGVRCNANSDMNYGYVERYESQMLPHRLSPLVQSAILFEVVSKFFDSSGRLGQFQLSYILENAILLSTRFHKLLLNERRSFLGVDHFQEPVHNTVDHQQLLLHLTSPNASSPHILSKLYVCKDYRFVSECLNGNVDERILFL